MGQIINTEGFNHSDVSVEAKLAIRCSVNSVKLMSVPTRYSERYTDHDVSWYKQCKPFAFAL